MSRNILINPSVPLIDEVLTHLRPDGADYSGNLVVFPGKRPAHFLRRALGESEGRSFIPPSIFSFDTFVDYLFDRKGGEERQIGAVDAAVILYEIHRSLPDRIGGSEFDSFDRFLPIGLRIFDELEELAMTSQPPSRIVPLLHGVSLRGIHSLGTFYERFYPDVAKRGLSTRATRYAAVTADPPPTVFDQFSRMVFAGMFSFTNVELDLIRHLQEREETVFVFQDGPGMRNRLDEMKLRAEEKGDEPPHPTITFHSAPDSHGEVFALAARIDEFREAKNTLDHHSVILVPDPGVIPPLVHHALSILDEPYNISIGYPHSRTPVVGFLTSLMEAVSSRHEGKFQAAEYLKLVLHPYTRSILLDGSFNPTRVLFQVIEDFFIRGTFPNFFRLGDLEAHEEVFARVSVILGSDEVKPEKLRTHLRRIHENVITPLTAVRSLGECAQSCIDVLSFVANESTSRQHLFFRTYFESVIASLGNICQSLMAEIIIDDPRARFRIVRSCVIDGKVPLPGTPLQGLQVLGFLETRNLQFNNIFVLNANDDQIPGNARQYSLIPNIVRQELGLPTNREQDGIADYYFSLLLAGAKNVFLFFTENESKMPSRFVEKLLWKEEQVSGKESRPQLVSAAEYGITLTHSMPDSIDKTPGMIEILKSMTFSATGLDSYLKCGLQFYYRSVLRLHEKEELAGDIDRQEMGVFVHRVLAEYYSPFVGKELTGGLINARSLEELVDGRFRGSFGEEEFGNKYLLKIQLKQHLSEFLEKYEIPRLKANPVRLVGLEKEYSVEKNGYRFSGRIDRIEEREGRTYIYDYKTTGDKAKLVIRPGLLDTSDPTTWSRAIGSLQLPFYVLLAATGAGKSTSLFSPSYLLLGKAVFDAGTEVPLFEEPISHELLYGQLEQIIFQLLEELTDPSKKFEPPVDLQETCPYCPFTKLCGTEWVKKKGYF